MTAEAGICAISWSMLGLVGSSIRKRGIYIRILNDLLLTIQPIVNHQYERVRMKFLLLTTKVTINSNIFGMSNLLALSITLVSPNISRIEI